MDSDHASNKEDKKSISRALYMLGGMLTNWMSKTGQSLTLSSTESECTTISYGLTKHIFQQMLLEELGVAIKPGFILEDNSGAIFLVKNN